MLVLTIGKPEPHHDTNNNSRDALQDKQPIKLVRQRDINGATSNLPLPAGQTSFSVKERDTSSQQTSKSTGYCDTGSKDGHSSRSLLWLVPKAKVHHDTIQSAKPLFPRKTSNSPRKETSLGETEKDSHNQQTGICRNGGGADGDNTPRDHDSRDPLARRKVLEEDVAGELHQDVGDEEEGHGDVVLLAGEVELGHDVVLGGVIVECACVAQVDSIEVVLGMSVDAIMRVYMHILSR